MRSARLALVAAALSLLLAGCGGVGIIYTHTVAPLSLNMDKTRIVQLDKTGDLKHVQLWQVGFAWDSVAFGDIAKKSGLSELYFADLETLRVLTIWNEYTVHLYGK